MQQALGSLLEAGYTILALVLPVIWLVLMFLCHRSSRKSAKEAEREARNSTTDLGALVAFGVGMTGSLFLFFIQIILALLLVINILAVTIPYGQSHGLW